MKLSYKIPLLFILVGLSVLISSSLISYFELKKVIREQSLQKITALRESKKREIKSYFLNINSILSGLASDLTTRKAMNSFSKEFSHIGGNKLTNKKDQELKDYYKNKFLTRLNKYSDSMLSILKVVPDKNNEKLLQYYYVANGKDKNALGYEKTHDLYHREFEKAQKNNKLYDVFLIDTDGNIVYSVFKEIDFATNLNYGPHKDSGLADVYKQSISSSSPNSMSVADFKPYIPSYNKPAFFLATPIQENNKTIGVIAFQISIEKINSIMTSDGAWEKEGYGKTGETYIIADDYSMRNDSRFLIEDREKYLSELKKSGVSNEIIYKIRGNNTSICFQKVITFASKEALSGVTGTKIISDYRGIDVISSYSPININGLKWSIISEIDIEEAYKPVYRIKKVYFMFSIFIFIVVLFVSLLITKKITTPLLNLLSLTKDISGEDFSKRIIVDSKDEIGELSRAFNSMTSSLEVSTVSKDYMDMVMSSMGEALFVLKSVTGKLSDLRVVTVNDAALRLLCCDKVDIIYNDLGEFTDGGILLTDHELVLMKGKSEIITSEKMFINKKGRHIPVIFTVSIMIDKRGNQDEFNCVCVVKDISERKQVEEKLKLSSAVFNSSAEPVLITDNKGNIVDANAAFEYSSGMKRYILKKMNVSDFELPGELDFYDVIEKAAIDKFWRGEVFFMENNFIMSVSLVKSEDEVISNYIFVLSDIGELKNKEQRILKMAHHDALTGLPNRVLFDERLSQAIKNSKRIKKQLGLLYLDLDGFKFVNDTYGHLAGDELLIEVSNRIQDILRDVDTVARLGGDEFAVVLPEIDFNKNIMIVAEKILSVVREPYELSMATANISVSIGAACYPDDAIEKNDLTNAADSAMYDAKNKGKNNIQFYQSLHG